ncbi:MAG: phosphate/phosphite/phosphonate ABC transporter substrate-binding protein [Candidatus Ozemobacteraceae bacterium]
MKKVWSIGRWVIGLALFAGLVWAAFVQTGPVGRSDLQITWTVSPKSPLYLGVIPYMNETALSREMGPIMAYLSRHLKQEVKMNVASDYEALGRLLDLGKVQMAWFTSTSFERLNRVGIWETLCRPLRDGKAGHFGVIAVRADGQIKTIADLKGRRFAYVDRFSGTGFVQANLLFREQGIDPLTFFREVVLTGNHSFSIDGLMKGEFDGAAVFDIFGDQADGGLGSATSSLVSIATTGFILNDPVVVRKDMDSALKFRLRELFIHMSEHEGGKEVLAELNRLRHWNAFIP